MEIADKVLREAGFEVFVHAAGREDLNDWHPEKLNNYVRAVHLLRHPSTSFTDSFPGIYAAIGGYACENPQFNVVAYGLLPKEVTVQREVGKKRWEKRKKSGLSGLFGGEEDVLVPYTSVESVIEYQGKQRLSDLVETQDTSDAHFAELSIRARIEDRPSRRVGKFPVLNIIGSRNLIQEVVGYLSCNPKLYDEFIKSLLSKERFPRVNSGIVAKTRPAEAIVFLDAARIQKIDGMNLTGDDGALKDWVYGRYGRKVEV
jgi:hypothetical protein